MIDFCYCCCNEPEDEPCEGCGRQPTRYSEEYLQEWKEEVAHDE